MLDANTEALEGSFLTTCLGWREELETATEFDKRLLLTFTLPTSPQHHANMTKPQSRKLDLVRNILVCFPLFGQDFL